MSACISDEVYAVCFISFKILLFTQSSILTEYEEPQETQELVEKGVIPASIYAEYSRNGAGVPFLIFAALFLIVAQMASNAADFWVTWW